MSLRLPSDKLPHRTDHRRPSYRILFSLLLCTIIAISIGLLAPGAASQSQVGFADPAFQATWDRTDGLVASTTVSRPWVWGPVPGESLTEPFSGLPGNSHLVQYFDKGRMEINDRNADPKDPFYVTNGRLSIELISGQMQTGILI